MLIIEQSIHNRPAIEASSHEREGAATAPENRLAMSFLPGDKRPNWNDVEPMTAKAPRTKDKELDDVEAELYECRAPGPADDNGKQKKGAGPPTLKYIASFYTGDSMEANEATKVKLAADIKHGKIGTATKFELESQFPNGAPLVKPSKVTVEVFNPAGFELAVSKIEEIVGKPVRVKNRSLIKSAYLSFEQYGVEVHIKGGAIRWLDGDDKEYNWLSKIHSSGKFVMRENAYVITGNDEDHATELLERAKDLCRFLGYQEARAPWCDSSIHLTHCASDPRSPRSPFTQLQNDPQHNLRDFGIALLITKEFQAMGATPCEMAREIKKLTCDAVYRDEWEKCMRVSWARALFRLHVRNYPLQHAMRI